MIVSGETQYIPALKTMWKRCFPTDTDSFITFYFDEIYKNEDTLIYLEQDQAIAALQIIPYSIKIDNAIHLGGYISGAMTHPDYRKRGCMKKLLNEAFSVMKSRNFVYSFLIPEENWLFNFYDKYGYIKAFPVNQENIVCHCKGKAQSNEVNIAKQLSEVDLNDFYTIYSGFLMEKSNGILKSNQQIDNILWDFFDGKGILFFNNRGIAFTLLQEGRVCIKEFFYFDEEIKGDFLKKIGEYYQEKEITISNDSSTPFLKYQGMIKRLDESAIFSTDIYMSMMLN